MGWGGVWRGGWSRMSALEHAVNMPPASPIVPTEGLDDDMYCHVA